MALGSGSSKWFLWILATHFINLVSIYHQCILSCTSQEKERHWLMNKRFCLNGWMVIFCSHSFPFMPSSHNIWISNRLKDIQCHGYQQGWRPNMFHNSCLCVFGQLRLWVVTFFQTDTSNYSSCLLEFLCKVIVFLCPFSHGLLLDSRSLQLYVYCTMSISVSRVLSWNFCGRQITTEPETQIQCMAFIAHWANASVANRVSVVCVRA